MKPTPGRHDAEAYGRTDTGSHDKLLSQRVGGQGLLPRLGE